MFTHVTVGTNDPDRARQFYDAVFKALGIPGQHTPKGAAYYNPDPAAASGMFGSTFALISASLGNSSGGGTSGICA